MLFVFNVGWSLNQSIIFLSYASVYGGSGVIAKAGGEWFGLLLALFPNSFRVGRAGILGNLSGYGRHIQWLFYGQFGL